MHVPLKIFRKVSLYPTLMGSKIPTSKFSESKEFRWGSTAHKSPIGEG